MEIFYDVILMAYFQLRNLYDPIKITSYVVV